MAFNKVEDLINTVDNKKVMLKIINDYGDYPNDSFVSNDLKAMFLKWYVKELYNVDYIVSTP